MGADTKPPAIPRKRDGKPTAAAAAAAVVVAADNSKRRSDTASKPTAAVGAAAAIAAAAADNSKGRSDTVPKPTIVVITSSGSSKREEGKKYKKRKHSLDDIGHGDKATQKQGDSYAGGSKQSKGSKVKGEEKNVMEKQSIASKEKEKGKSKDKVEEKSAMEKKEKAAEAPSDVITLQSPAGRMRSRSEHGRPTAREGDGPPKTADTQSPMESGAVVGTVTGNGGHCTGNGASTANVAGMPTAIDEAKLLSDWANAAVSIDGIGFFDGELLTSSDAQVGSLCSHISCRKHTRAYHLADHAFPCTRPHTLVLCTYLNH
jgi:hypothetical protein